MKVADTQEYNIFTGIWENLQNKRVRKLRFVKCDKCRKITPYRLMNVENSLVICNKCENSTPISDCFPRIIGFRD